MWTNPVDILLTGSSFSRYASSLSLPSVLSSSVLSITYSGSRQNSNAPARYCKVAVLELLSISRRAHPCPSPCPPTYLCPYFCPYLCPYFRLYLRPRPYSYLYLCPVTVFIVAMESLTLLVTPRCRPQPGSIPLWYASSVLVLNRRTVA